MRAFFGIPLDDGLRSGVEKAQEDLRSAGADVTWVRPASLHLTVKFLGDISDSTRFDWRPPPPFDLKLRGVGEFNGRVVWAGCEGELAPLGDIARRAEELGLKVGVPREDRRFSPHVTIGRIKSKRGLRDLRAAMKRWEGHLFGPWPVRRIVLFRSETSPRGSVYRVVAEYPLES